MPEEAQYIIQLLGLKTTQIIGQCTFFENEEIVLALSGIGKIQAAIGTTLLCSQYTLWSLINIGIAWNLIGQMAHIGDVFLVDKIQQHDLYLPFDGKHLDPIKNPILLSYEPPQFPEHLGFTVHQWGFCLTGDQFIDDQRKVTELWISTGAQLVEMEAFAVVSVSRSFGLLSQTVVIKSISDGADCDARGAHESNLDIAMQHSIEVLKYFL